MTNTIREEELVSKNGRPMKRGVCSVCGKVKMQFIKKKDLTAKQGGQTKPKQGGQVKPKQVGRWSNQLADELHKPITKKFKKRRVYSRGIDQIWAADLVDMQALSRENRNVKYLLTVIDVFSKYGWMIPLKDKTGKSVASALRTIFKESSRKPQKMWVDKGKEFYNKDVKNLVEIYSTENEEKSSVVERWNRTMKDKMFRYFTANSTRKYIDVLDDLVDQYNNTKHRSIKMTPVEASLSKNSY